MKMRLDMTKEELARCDHFLFCCRKAGVPATPRQASKFRNQRGQAYAVHAEISNGNRKGKGGENGN